MSRLQDIIFPRLSSFLRLRNSQGEIIPVKIDHTFISQGSQFPGHGAAPLGGFWGISIYSTVKDPAEGGLSLPLCLHGQIGEDLFPHGSLG